MCDKMFELTTYDRLWGVLEVQRRLPSLGLDLNLRKCKLFCPPYVDTVTQAAFSDIPQFSQGTHFPRSQDKEQKSPNFGN